MRVSPISSSPGQTLLDACTHASAELVLVAPFIRTEPLRRLLASLREDVELVCVTRWLPSEIASGISELEVYEVVAQHGGQLWLRQDLHAKYFRADSIGLIGSANISASALGWTTTPNLELIVEIEGASEALLDFENLVLGEAVLVDQERYEIFLAASKEWEVPEEHCRLGMAEGSEDTPVDTALWIPASRSPELLYRVYCVTDIEEIPTLALEAARLDLSVLQLPDGLSEDAFVRSVGAVLLSTPVIAMVDRYLVTPQRFGAVRELIKTQLSLSRDEATRAWQTLIRWMRYFLSTRYEYGRPRHSEIMVRSNVNEMTETSA